jgi:LytS/YehU family sensor histidine kinase
MQYHIYECTREKVELSKELKNIHNYISLQQIRLASQPRINVEVKGDLQTNTLLPAAHHFR